MQAKSGSGKTLMMVLFIVQWICKGGGQGNVQAICICPTRELAAQVAALTRELCADIEARITVLCTSDKAASTRGR